MLIFIYLLNSIAKTIEDPVAKHDINECSNYLCSSYSSLASEYIATGCIGSFDNYVDTKISTTKLNKIINYDTDKINYDSNFNNNFITILFAILIISFYIGFRCSKII